jgi:hypothetical protein
MKLLAAALALMFAATPAIGSAPPPGLRLVDLTDEFDRFATSTVGMADTERVAAFEKQIGPLADGFYSRARKPKNYDERVANHLKNYPLLRDGILAVSRDFHRLFGPARDSFQAVFGPVSSAQPVYLLDSMGEMDGGTRELNRKETLLFGADVSAKIHYGKDMAPFFHHELFHVYHGPVMADCDALWCSMWEEGLATYVAKALNPQAGDAALMLDQPAPIRPAVDANRTGAVCAVRPLLDSQKEEDYAALFYGNSHLPGFPARTGYYLGYLVAADLAKTHSLHRLAEMKPAEVKPLFDASLVRMADCPTPAKADGSERG